MLDFLDPYDIRAKIAPALVIALPGGVAVAALVTNEQTPYLNWVAGISGMAVAVLVATLVRDRGKAQESKLFASWGGKPTSCLMRRSDGTIDGLLKIRYRLNLEKIVAGFVSPTQQDEVRDPYGADRQYEMAAKWLIEHTTDKAKFPKVFAHNCGYGFRRNLFGSRDYGFMSSGVATGIAIWLLYHSGFTGSAILASIAAVGGWLIFGIAVNSDYVRRAGFDYGEHLIAASDSLAGDKK